MKHCLMILLALLSALSVSAGNNRVYIEDFEIMGDSVITVPVMLANEDPTRGVQFNLTLPPGLVMEECVLTETSEEDYVMSLSCNYIRVDSCYQIILFPRMRVCYNPGTLAILNLDLKAEPDFKGGEITLWKCFGSTIDNVAFPVQGGTTTVTVPSSSLIQVPADSQPVNQQYFNLMGHPLKSPDCAPVAIVVTTTANGQCSSRKVAIGH